MSSRLKQYGEKVATVAFNESLGRGAPGNDAYVSMVELTRMLEGSSSMAEPNYMQERREADNGEED